MQGYQVVNFASHLKPLRVLIGTILQYYIFSVYDTYISVPNVLIENSLNVVLELEEFEIMLKDSYRKKV